MGHRRNWFRTRPIRRPSHGRRLTIESLEPRLALTWAGIPPVSVSPPSNAVAVTLNAQNDATGTASIATTEIDYYSFIARGSGSYVISATTPSSSVDTVVGVFSASGQRLAYNDDIAANNTDSRLTINLTAGVRYYLGVTNYTSSSRGAYTWTIDGPATVTAVDDAYENNDSFGTAYNLGTLTASRTISQLKLVDAEDWYRFTTSATGTSANSVSISFQNTQGNLQLALYNSAGTVLGSSQGTGNSETISISGRAPGTYYVRVYGNLGATNPNYTLSINPPTVTTPPPPTTGTGGFQIAMTMSGLTVSQQGIFQQAARRWEQVIVGDLPNATYAGQVVDDLLINARARAIDGVNGILGRAGPDAFRSGSRLPYHGVMEFDTADLARMEQNGSLLGVVLHEIGHILGIGTIWQSLGLLSGAGTSNPIFVGARATAAYNQIFATAARGVPVESGGGPGTALGHWRDTIFRSEVMTGWIGPGTSLPLSRVTVASLADIGYSVNYAAADSYVPSSTALAIAAQSTTSTTTSARFYGVYIVSTSPAERVADARVSSSPASVQPIRPRVLERPAVRLNTEVVDAVMTGVRRTADEAPTNSIAPREVEDAAVNRAWIELEFDWEIWPTLSLT